jgi:broad specificity phosphatase PhoE
MQRRPALLALGALALGAAQARAQSVGWGALRPGDALLLRHARAPGTGDPEGFRLGDCRSQRNLDADGRDQARRLGDRLREALAAQALSVVAVWASPWCRTLETAALAFPGQSVEPRAAWASFFAERDREPRLTQAAQGELGAFAAAPSGGVLVVVTHQVNISALTGIVPASGEGVWVRGRAGAPQVLGRWLAD